ncbi:hemerythrin domain-containing protein [Candidatus Woesearchaeota archaeon]|nr:hemerythrin domain-containing protein [Candidatus Woesearchaeota archaeon]
MVNSDALKILIKEHENILIVVERLEKELKELKNKEIDTDFFEKIIKFIRGYADKFHHAKEEDILFKEFNKCAEEGCVHCNPVEQMLFEHDEGRKNLKLIEAGLKEKNKTKLIEGVKGYISIIKEHIFKEDNILYPMADSAFSTNTKNKILSKFKLIEQKEKDMKYYYGIIKSFEGKK